jgi:hypothetical protein
MSYANQEAAEAGGWTFTFIGDHVGELRLERPSAWKIIDGNRKEVVSVDAAGVLRAIEETEAVHSQHLVNVAYQKKQEADAKKAEK